ncbi:MAG: energy transducer TonB [Planctomycetaceae bacterium]
MRHSFSIAEASEDSPRGAVRLLREWLPSWSGSVLIHGAAVCCFVAVRESGPQIWSVTRGHNSSESAPALDSRAGGLLAKQEDQMPPLLLEVLNPTDLPAVNPSPQRSRATVEALRDFAETSSREAIDHHVEILLSDRSRSHISPTPQVSEEQSLVTRVDLGSIRDDELLRPLDSMTETTNSSDKTSSESGSSASRGNAAEDSTAATASAASQGADDDQLPQPVATNVAPPYPEAARAAGLQGKVTLRLRIAADGHVESLKILISSGVPSLDESALATVKKWRFEPARRFGQPVAMDVKTSVNFQIAVE